MSRHYRDVIVRTGHVSTNMVFLSRLEAREANAFWRKAKHVLAAPHEYSREIVSMAELIADPKVAALKQMGGQAAEVSIAREKYEQFLESVTTA